MEDLFVGHVDLSDVKNVGYANAHAIAADVLKRFDAGEFDVATIFYNRFVKSVISQIPTAQQIIPAAFEDAADDRNAPCTITSPARKTSWPICCRAVSRRRSSPLCWKTVRPSKARG